MKTLIAALVLFALAVLPLVARADGGGGGY